MVPEHGVLIGVGVAASTIVIVANAVKQEWDDWRSDVRRLRAERRR